MHKLVFAVALTPFLAYGYDETGKDRQEKTQEMVCSSPFQVMHVDVRHTESNGLGYEDGYTTVEGFGIYDYCSHFMPFLDLRGHVFNNGQLAANVGIGERSFLSSINHLFGVYLYYDVRQSEHHLTVNELSPGIELLGKRMEYRVNAYFPVGRDESHRYQNHFHRFHGNRILVQHKRKYAMTGVDAEVGAHLTQSVVHDFYFGVGPYYFTADPNSFWGGKARLNWRYQDYILLEATYSYDHIFKNIVQGTVAFSYPFGPKLKRKTQNCPETPDLALSRGAFAPYRFEIPVVETRKHVEAARSAATKAPITAWFVDNTSHSAGTYESPFSTLSAAQNASGPYDIIYVKPGDGTTNGMNTGITLQNGQMLFGSGTRQHIHTTKGKVSIPAFTATAPTITSSGSVVTLANGNEVSGMNIIVPGGSLFGLVNTGTINGAKIHHNVITSASGGISIAGFGPISIKKNVFIGTTPGSNMAGVSLTLTNGQFSNIDVSKNSFTGFGNAIFLQPSVNLSTTAICTANITKNTLTGFADTGIFIANGFPNSTFTINQNLINNTVGTVGGNAGGIVVSCLNANNSGTYSITENNVTTTSTTANVNGILVTSTAGAPSPTTANVLISNNFVIAGTGAGSDGIQISMNFAGSTICANVSDNTVQTFNTATSGINLNATAGSTLNIDDFSDNVGHVGVTGANTVAPNTCGF
jgi:hypothetical protein